jgi:gas vesicle protein
MQKDNNSLLFFSGVILGAVVGGAMGILFAPQSGEDTRLELSKKGKKLYKEMRKNAGEVGKKLEPTIREVQKQVGEKLDEVKEGFTEGIKSVRK